VVAYAASPTETRIIFDRAIKPAYLPGAAKGVVVEMGRYVSAGERFESFRPGYQAVKMQRTMPRFELAVASARGLPDRRSLALETAARVEAVNYAVRLPGLGEAANQSEMDLLTDLTGVEVAWKGDGTDWSGWLPHLDLTAARGFTAASLEHQKLFQALEKPGTLTMRCQLDLWQMLHPATQPGSKLDHEYAPETVTIVLKTRSKLSVRTNTKIEQTSDHEVRLTTSPMENAWLPVELTLKATDKAAANLDVSWFTAEDPRPRALPLRRILLPWATPNVALAIVNRIPEIEGGDWERGKKVFFSEQAACSKCHQVGGEGETIGPDLSNLIYRDYASVLRDVVEPSAAINPDHLAYQVELKNGEVETGVLLKNNHDEIVLGQAGGQHLTISKTNFLGMKPSAVSLMPEGLLKTLDAQSQKDLFTFLLTAPPKTNRTAAAR
jgi:putative heme-binding domain-containing protein